MDIQPCAAGSQLSNPNYEDWITPCPNPGTHLLAIDPEGFFYLCISHIESMDKIMEGVEGYEKYPI